MLEELTIEECININGGHNGTSYNIGRIVGDAVARAAVVIGIAVLILMPKS